MKIQFKMCSKCNEEKDIAEFYKNRKSRDGLYCYCKTCAKKKNKNYYNNNKNQIIERTSKYYEENKDDLKGRMMIYRKENPEKFTESAIRFRQENPERYKSYQKDYRENNKEKFREYAKKWQKNNPEKKAHWVALRRNRKSKRTPTWLTDGHIKDIKKKYEEARILTNKTGIEYHVDHIFPLNGESFSGLHVPWNLQVIPATDNLSKGNRLNKEEICAYNF